MANSARARSTCAAGALSERLRRVSSWRSSAVSGRRGSFRWRDMGHLGARGSPHHYTSSHGRRPTGLAEAKRVLRDAFKRLEQELPERVARILRKLRHPDARWVRIPVGLLCVVGGVFSFLPVLGLWMLPLGLLLIAYDVPFLRKPVGYFTIWGAEKWAGFQLWLSR